MAFVDYWLRHAAAPSAEASHPFSSAPSLKWL